MSTISGVSSSSSGSDPWAAMKAQRSQMQAKMFAKVDADSSGSVDKAELKTMLSDISQKTGTSIGSDSDATFTKMDSNADGQLSTDELGKGMQSLMPPPSTMDFAQSRSADGAGGSGGSQDDLFSKVDTNSDGTLDKAELKTLTDKMKASSDANATEDSDAMFATLDTDSDGKLTQTEFAAGRPQGGPQGNSGSGGPDGPPPAGGPGGPGGGGGAGKTEYSDSTTYDTLDTNQDGTVSELERLMGAIKDASKSSTSDSASSKSDDASSSSESESTATSASFVDVAKLAKQLYAQMSASFLGTSGSTLSVTA
jgi:Ca2+-binding EF-hand superfamily protein